MQGAHSTHKQDSKCDTTIYKPSKSDFTGKVFALNSKVDRRSMTYIKGVQTPPQLELLPIH